MMKSKMKKVLGRKVGRGRFMLPVWTLAIAVAIIAAAAGQAVGPVLAGSLTGTVSVVVEQSITLDTDYPIGDNPTVSTSGTADSVATRNDEGTHFTLAAELHQGEEVTLDLFLQNDSGEDSASILELNVPAGLDIEITEVEDGTTVGVSAIKEAQMSRTQWLLAIDSSVGTGTSSDSEDTTLTNFCQELIRNQYLKSVNEAMLELVPGNGYATPQFYHPERRWNPTRIWRLTQEKDGPLASLLHSG